ncbi:hypothetical protein FOZ62_031033 [Perkinsus olseni]|uniref:Uncharacterized protein n=1 Tax=Perkinsus olseni TaxID=32597 RepID=A0A7J6TTV6_PEROL|nr:hypothetical protein FOZ62_031033 [Perkinsus olseni]
MAFILKFLISALLVSSVFSKRILDGKYASDIDSEDFMVVFIVNRLNGAQTVDVIYRCDQDYGGVAGPFPMRPGSDSNEYIIGVGSAASLHTEIRDLCSNSVALADGDLLTLKKNSDGPSKTWSDEEYSPLSYYGNIQPIFTCKGTTMRFGSLELLREKSDFPFVEYIVGEDWELAYWQSFIYKVGQVCGKDLHPDDFLYMLHATHNKVATTLEGEYIDLTVT